MKKKILFIAPHLSTGGMPQYLLKILENIKNDFKLYVIEYNFLSPHYIVQRNGIINLIGSDHFKSLGDNKYELFDFIKKIDPDIIHMQEIPEMFMHNQVAKRLYNLNCYIIETSHDSGFDVRYDKKFFPDKHLFISDFHPNIYKKFFSDIDYDIVEYPVENKTRPDRTKALNELNLDENKVHILNVGLFTPRKNQKEIIDYAKFLEEENVQFHFIGNLAPNFKYYWESLTQNLPKNVVIWGERNDVDKFYSSMDLFLFTSKGNSNDRETNPLVLKEALSWNMPVFMYNLDVYMGKYDNEQTITYLSEDFNQNIIKLKKFIRNNDTLNNISDNTLNNTSNNIEMAEGKKYYITLCTEDYEQIVSNLAKSLYYFSKYPLIVYCINYTREVTWLKQYENVEVVYITREEIEVPDTIRNKNGDLEINRKEINTYKILSLKPAILKKFIDDYLENIMDSGVFLDGDMVVNRNIDDIFNYQNLFDVYPLVGEGPFEYMTMDGRSDIEKPFIERMGWDYSQIKRMWYRQSNIFIFNKNSYRFFERWFELMNEPFILEDVYTYAPFQDETILNILMWVENNDKILPQLAMNAIDVETVKCFYNAIVEENFNSKMNRIHLNELKNYKNFNNDLSWFASPYNKNHIKCFHGIKSKQKSDDIISYIKKFDNYCKELQNSIKLSVNSEENKIQIEKATDDNTKFPEKNVAVVKDKDTKLPFFPAYNINYNWFIVPISTNVFKFSTNKIFRGFYIDFYDEFDNKLFKSDDVVLHPNEKDENKITFYNTDFYDSFYYSYMEFFEVDIYNHFHFNDLNVVVDIGANSGIATEYFFSKGANKVYCVEPMERAYQFMWGDLKIKYGDRVQLRNISIYSYNGNMELYTPKTNTEVTTIFPDKAKQYYNEEYNKVTIPCQTFETFCNNENINNISLLKVDIEGSEYEMFRVTSKEFLENNVDKIILEFHYNSNEQLKKDILPKLENFNYYVKKQGKLEDGNVNEYRGMLFAYNKKIQSHIPIHEDSSKKAVIIDYYYQVDKDEKMLLDTLKKFEKYNYDIVLVSHCTKISDEIFDKINYFIYDSDNTFNEVKNFPWVVQDNYKIEYRNENSHAYPVMRSIYNGVSFLKGKYDYFYFIEYDSYLDQEDLNKFINQKQKIDKSDKRLWFMNNTVNWGEYKGKTFYETLAFQGYVNDFIKVFEEQNFVPSCLEEYKKKFSGVYPSHLERVFYSLFKKYRDLIYEVFTDHYSFFNNSDINLSGAKGLIVSRMFNYYEYSEEKYVIFNSENSGINVYLYKFNNSSSPDEVFRLDGMTFRVLDKDDYNKLKTDRGDDIYLNDDSLDEMGFYQKLN